MSSKPTLAPRTSLLNQADASEEANISKDLSQDNPKQRRGDKSPNAQVRTGDGRGNTGSGPPRPAALPAPSMGALRSLPP